jgi:uncharacterized membrane-anchored protein
VIVVIIVMTAIGCNDIIKRYKYNHAESNDETQNLQQVKIIMCYVGTCYLYIFLSQVDAEDTEK